MGKKLPKFTLKKGNTKITQARIIEAFQKTGGLVTQTAKKLKVTRQAIYKRLKGSSKLRKAKLDAEEINLDIAETKLIANVKKGDNASIFFYLKCKGKSRGYVERQEINIKDERVEIKAPSIPGLPEPDDAI